MKLGLPSVLFVVFLVLKLTHYIDWSWWWVTAPIWVACLSMFILLSFIAVMEALEERREKLRKNV